MRELRRSRAISPTVFPRLLVPTLIVSMHPLACRFLPAPAPSHPPTSMSHIIYRRHLGTGGHSLRDSGAMQPSWPDTALQQGAGGCGREQGVGMVWVRVRCGCRREQGVDAIRWVWGESHCLLLAPLFPLHQAGRQAGRQPLCIRLCHDVGRVYALFQRHRYSVYVSRAASEAGKRQSTSPVWGRGFAWPPSLLL